MTEPDRAAPRILVIDDEKGIRRMLLYALPKQGYQVAAAASALEGLAKMKEEEFDVVLCDIRMPGMDGVETLKALKAVCPSTEVMLSTGYATEDQEDQCRKLGACDYVLKPYDLVDLGKRLEKAVQSKRLKSSLS